MPAQGGDPRVYGPSSPFPRSPWRKAAEASERENDLFVLWHECYDSALAHLQPQLRAAWIDAERRYIEIATERGWL